MWRSAKNQFKDEITSRIVEARNVIVPSDGAKNAGALETASEIVLQHGNSALKRFTLKTWRSTLFMPAAYILQFQVQYKIDDVLNQDTIRQQFNLRAPMGAVLRGACWGALVGSILHTLYGLNGAAVTSLDRKGFFELVTQTFAGILLGGVLVVAFARKKDAQPFISIEDFYGGFFVGFSAGYVGKALLEKVLPK